MKGSENSGQRKKQAAEFSEGKGQRKAAKLSVKNGQRNSAKLSEKKRAAKGSGIQRKKNRQREFQRAQRLSVLSLTSDQRTEAGWVVVLT